MRYAAKKDVNEKLIVDFMRKAGASVYIAGLPVDLIVGYRGQTHLVEQTQSVWQTRFKRQPKRVCDKLAWQSRGHHRNGRGRTRIFESPRQQPKIDI